MLLTHSIANARANEPTVTTETTETVADRMAPAVTVTGGAGLEQVVDAIQRWRVPAVAVADGFGRILGAVDPDDYPDLFDGASAGTGVRVAGTPRQRRRRDGRATATALDLMTPAVTVPATWQPAQARRALTGAGAVYAFVVDELGRVTGSLRLARLAP